MNATLYNPCPDGLPAKAWECLRRNKAFRKRAERFQKLRTERTKLQSVLTCRTWLHRMQHPLARVALECLFPMDHEKEKWLRVVFTVDTKWPDTPEHFREAFASVLTPLDAGAEQDPWAPPTRSQYVLPMRIPPPPKGILGRINSPKGQDELVAWLLQYERLLKEGAWSIPQTIRDPAHRKAVMAELGKAMPKARLSAGPETQRGSSFLGTEADWDTWLFITALRKKSGLSLLKAEPLASWRRFDPKGYWKCPAGDRPYKVGVPAIHKSVHHITKSRKAVDEAIKSVYPITNEIG